MTDNFAISLVRTPAPAGRPPSCAPAPLSANGAALSKATNARILASELGPSGKSQLGAKVRPLGTGLPNCLPIGESK